METYLTVAARAEDAFVERKSRFIGSIAPVCTEEAAERFIDGVRVQYKDANHHVYAYVLKNGFQRCSDDGEPSGTAGVPVLEVIRREGLVDTAVVVTRCFGGVLLGTGGLTRAYSHGAKLAVDAGGRRKMEQCMIVSIKTPYDLYGKLTHMLQNYRIKLLDTSFLEAVGVRLMIPCADQKRLEQEIIDFSSGTMGILVEETLWDEIKA